MIHIITARDKHFKYENILVLLALIIIGTTRRFYFVLNVSFVMFNCMKFVNKLLGVLNLLQKMETWIIKKTSFTIIAIFSLFMIVIMHAMPMYENYSLWNLPRITESTKHTGGLFYIEMVHALKVLSTMTTIE